MAEIFAMLVVTVLNSQTNCFEGKQLLAATLVAS